MSARCEDQRGGWIGCLAFVVLFWLLFFGGCAKVEHYLTSKDSAIVKSQQLEKQRLELERQKLELEKLKLQKNASATAEKL